MLARSTGGTRPACIQSAAGAGRTASERKSSELSWVIGTSMRSGWPNADTMRECPKPAAYEVEHASNDAATATTKGLVLKTNAIDDSTQREICILDLKRTRLYSNHS